MSASQSLIVETKLQKPRSRIGYRRVASGNEATILSRIYEEDVNMVIWRRAHTLSLSRSAEQLLALDTNLALSLITEPNCVNKSVSAALPENYRGPLADDVTELVDMFCYLFEVKRVGLRLTTLDRAMCPRFHVDMIPCRLVSTYCGRTTEWLYDEVVDRTKLGMGHHGKSDLQSGIYGHQKDVQELEPGDVALLKGGAWTGNEGAGLVHRSPSLAAGEKRLLLTVDFVN